jgi:hypothetical protein
MRYGCCLIFFPWRLTRYSFAASPDTALVLALPFFFAWCFVLSILEPLDPTRLCRSTLPPYLFVTSLAFGVVPQTFILVDFLIRRSFFFFG